MKVKTITCHEVYNYGASLQEYALLRYFQDLGHDAETIHYKPPYLSNHFNMWSISNPSFDKNFFLRIIYILFKLPKRIINLKRKKSFDLFSRNYVKTTKTLYRNNDELKANSPEADVYVCGSDQIWNSFFQNGKDPAFYLDFVPENKLKLSYAASFAIDHLESDIKPFVKEKVSKLDYISVRESSGKKILEDLGFSNVYQVLDPVFLLPSNIWDALLSPEVENQKYILVYDFDSNPLIEKMAKELKNKYGWKIITVNEMIHYADKNYYLNGPDKFLTLVKNASFVISNSFHAVAFSIIFKKDFVVFNRSDKINTRMRDLLRSIKLENLLITNEVKISNYKIGSIDYDNVNFILEELINKSKDYLNKALNNHSAL